MAEEPIEIIRIDDLLKARRRCTVAAFPSWHGWIPALVFAVISLTDGMLSFAVHAAIASAVFAGYGLMVEGRVLGGILQLGGRRRADDRVGPVDAAPRQCDPRVFPGAAICEDAILAVRWRGYPLSVVGRPCDRSLSEHCRAPPAR